MDLKTCVVHYAGRENYSKMKDVSLINEQQRRKAKSIREKNGGHHHKEQCDSIPEKIDPEKHGIHLNPCYKKFTLIISQSKHSEEKPSRRTSCRSKSDDSINSIAQHYWQ